MDWEKTGMCLNDIKVCIFIYLNVSVAERPVWWCTTALMMKKKTPGWAQKSAAWMEARFGLITNSSSGLTVNSSSRQPGTCSNDASRSQLTHHLMMQEGENLREIRINGPGSQIPK